MWIRAVKTKGEEAEAMQTGRRISSHTLRLSYARHLLVTGLPTSYHSHRLERSSVQTTLI